MDPTSIGDDEMALKGIQLTDILGKSKFAQLCWKLIGLKGNWMECYQTLSARKAENQLGFIRNPHHCLVRIAARTLYSILTSGSSILLTGARESIELTL